MKVEEIWRLFDKVASDAILAAITPGHIQVLTEAYNNQEDFLVHTDPADLVSQLRDGLTTGWQFMSELTCLLPGAMRAVDQETTNDKD